MSKVFTLVRGLREDWWGELLDIIEISTLLKEGLSKIMALPYEFGLFIYELIGRANCTS